MPISATNCRMILKVSSISFGLFVLIHQVHANYANTLSPESDESLPLNSLFHDSIVTSVVERKALFITFLETNILRHIDPYWHDFVPFIKQLVESCFVPGLDPQVVPNTVSYDSFVSILEKAKETVKDSYVAQYPIGAPKLKRVREEEVFARDGTTSAK